MSSEEKLSSYLKTGPDWGRLKTSVPGIFVLKMPAYKNSPARLAIELNPTDDSGSPTKRRGLVLRSSDELEEYKEIFQYDKLQPLLKSVDGVNPKQPPGPGTGMIRRESFDEGIMVLKLYSASNPLSALNIDLGNNPRRFSIPFRTGESPAW